jgi:hypothetical protein
MSRRFAEELARRGLPYVTVTGSPERRLADAVEAIDAVLATDAVEDIVAFLDGSPVRTL